MKYRSLHSWKLLFQCFFFLLASLLIVCACAGSGMLLVSDAPQLWMQRLVHAPFQAFPLLCIGLASLCFQTIVRPKLLDLFKAFMVSAAFLLWGIDQMLPAGWSATTLGDVVIVLYVIDLGWMMADRLKEQGWPKRAHQKAHPQSVSPAQHVRQPFFSHPYSSESFCLAFLLSLLHP